MVRKSLFVKVQSDKSMIEHVTENETTEDLEVRTPQTFDYFRTMTSESFRLTFCEYHSLRESIRETT